MFSKGGQQTAGSHAGTRILYAVNAFIHAVCYTRRIYPLIVRCSQKKPKKRVLSLNVPGIIQIKAINGRKSNQIPLKMCDMISHDATRIARTLFRRCCEDGPGISSPLPLCSLS